MQETRNVGLFFCNHCATWGNSVPDRIVFDADAANNPEKSTKEILNDNMLFNLRDAFFWDSYEDRAQNPMCTSIMYKGAKINFLNYDWHDPHRIYPLVDAVALYALDIKQLCNSKYLASTIKEKKRIFIVFDIRGWMKAGENDGTMAGLLRHLSDLGLSSEETNCKILFCHPIDGWMSDDWKKYTKPKMPFLHRTITLPDIYRKQRAKENFTLLLDTILKEVPATPVLEGSVQMLICNSRGGYYSIWGDCSGLVTRGRLREGQTIFLHKADGTVTEHKVEMLMTFFGNGRIRTDEVQCGDICSVFFQLNDPISGLKEVISISGEP